MENIDQSKLVISNVVFFVIGFVSGGFMSYMVGRWIRYNSIKNKLYGIDGTESVKTFLVIVVSFVWLVTTMSGVFTGSPIDASIHIIMGGVVGGYFGINMLGKRNEK